MIALGAAACAAPALAGAAPVVFAAASLKEVLDRVSDTILPMRLSYGGSAALARQVMQGAPADVFLSANPEWMDAVALRAIAGTRRDLLGNALVVVGAPDAAPFDLTDWPAEGRIAMGFVEAVPAGQYGMAALKSAGVWNDLRPRVVETDSVRAALALVARGELPFGIVYATDAAATPAVKVLHRFAPDLHPPIRYPIALFDEAGRGAYAALTSPAAAAIFAGAGFEVL